MIFMHFILKKSQQKYIHLHEFSQKSNANFPKCNFEDIFYFFLTHNCYIVEQSSRITRQGNRLFLKPSYGKGMVDSRWCSDESQKDPQPRESRRELKFLMSGVTGYKGIAMETRLLYISIKQRLHFLVLKSQKLRLGDIWV